MIGATNIDVISKPSSDILYDGPSNPAETSCTLGGVGRNIAGIFKAGSVPIVSTLVHSLLIHGKPSAAVPVYCLGLPWPTEMLLRAKIQKCYSTLVSMKAGDKVWHMFKCNKFLKNP